MQVRETAEDLPPEDQAGSALLSYITGSAAAAFNHSMASILERSVADIARIEALRSDSLLQAAQRECSPEDLRLDSPRLVISCWAVSCSNIARGPLGSHISQRAESGGLLGDRTLSELVDHASLSTE
ncbi:hypothetical protein WJX81_002491 [Elliptochloris bilobata]|uniref:Uncharacterized protein n=1 Tax=Elliptochloris bilobata TaxID=381761 RepID=A0AAW1SB26_9CHLO